MRLPNLSRLTVSPTGAVDDVRTEIHDERDEQLARREAEFERRARAFWAAVEPKHLERQRLREATERWTPDEVTLVVDAISKLHAADPIRASESIRNWCALNTKHRGACGKNGWPWADVFKRLFPAPLPDVYDAPRLGADGAADPVDEDYLNFLDVSHAYRIVDAATKDVYGRMLLITEEFFQEMRWRDQTPADYSYQAHHGIISLWDVLGTFKPAHEEVMRTFMQLLPGKDDFLLLNDANRSPLFHRLYRQLFYAVTLTCINTDRGRNRYFLLLPAKEDKPNTRTGLVDTGSPSFVFARLRAMAKVIGAYTVGLWALLSGTIAHYAQWDTARLEAAYREYLAEFQVAIVKAVYPSLKTNLDHSIYDMVPDVDVRRPNNLFARWLRKRVYAIMLLVRPQEGVDAVFTDDDWDLAPDGESDDDVDDGTE